MKDKKFEPGSFTHHILPVLRLTKTVTSVEHWVYTAVVRPIAQRRLRGHRKRVQSYGKSKSLESGMRYAYAPNDRRNGES